MEFIIKKTRRDDQDVVPLSSDLTYPVRKCGDYDLNIVFDLILTTA